MRLGIIYGHLVRKNSIFALVFADVAAHCFQNLVVFVSVLPIILVTGELVVLSEQVGDQFQRSTKHLF